MDKNLLDNMSGQEIRELVDNKIITLQELQDSALEKVLDFEIEMLCHGSGDMNLIRQCAETLDTRSKSDKLSLNEISGIINKTKSEYVVINDADNSPSIILPPRKRPFALKRVAIVAAAIIILIATTSAIATAFGIDIFKLISNIVRQSDETTIKVDEFTFQNLNIYRKYDSIEQLIEDEEIDIIYPSLLPDGVDIEIVRLTNNSNSNKVVQILTNDSDINVQIELGTNGFAPYVEKTYESNGITYYVRTKDVYSATCYYKNNTYYISANNYDDLILIIENMKE